MSESYTALQTYLAPINKILSTEGVSEVSINQPFEAWVEVKGDITRVDMPTYDLDYLKSMCRLVAQSTEQKISEEMPLLSATLPGGFRVQVVFPPACEQKSIVISIRKKSDIAWGLEDYEKMGAFENITTTEQTDPRGEELLQLLDNHEIKMFLRKAVLYKKNIIISGGTSTGKTTFTNGMLMEIPAEERLISVEDAREIILDTHPNRVHLLASKGGQGRAHVTTQDLIEACLRLRPDRIIVGELRGEEAFSFLRAINTGHPGSISTLHADTPYGAIEQLKMMVMQAGLGLPPSEIRDYVKSVVDIIVQLKRGDHGRRFVSAVYFKYKEEKLAKEKALAKARALARPVASKSAVAKPVAKSAVVAKPANVAK